jgi:VanZ family protein
VSPDSSRNPRVQTRWRWAAAGWLVFVSFIVFCADRRLFRSMFGFITSHPGLDKVGHFVLIGGTAFLLNLALGLREWRCLGRGWLLGSTVVAVVCTLEEISQLWFPSRTFDLFDLAADAAGILFFGWLARRVFRSGQQV